MCSVVFAATLAGAGTLLLLLIAWPVLAAAFAGTGHGAALAGLLVLHLCLPLLLSEQQFAAHPHQRFGIFFIRLSFDCP
jgi:hypothetical protein